MLILVMLLLLVILFLVYFLIELNQTKKQIYVKPNTYIVKPKRRHLIGGCSGTGYGCCPDGYTAKTITGSNCHTRHHLIGGCSGTRFGVSDGYTAKTITGV